MPPAIFIGGAALWSGVYLYTSRRHAVAEHEGKNDEHKEESAKEE